MTLSGETDRGSFFLFLLYPSSDSRQVGSYEYDLWGILEKNSIRYRGYYYDAETGFYYVSSRYCDPEIGRFINADDTEYLGADGSVLSYNLFAYCMNNPVNMQKILKRQIYSR